MLVVAAVVVAVVAAIAAAAAVATSNSLVPIMALCSLAVVVTPLVAGDWDAVVGLARLLGMIKLALQVCFASLFCCRLKPLYFMTECLILYILV